MDSETSTILQKSIEHWCEDNRELLSAAEYYPKTGVFNEQLFDGLNRLGVLDILTAHSGATAFELVACAAYHLARYSPSLALLMVQQNMAVFLCSDSPAFSGRGWLALPLYDAPIEWPFQTDPEQSDKSAVSGQWRLIPGLPEAKAVLVPLCGDADHEFRLLAIALGQAQASVTISAPVLTLGLRACPVADLTLSSHPVSGGQVIAQGATALQKVKVLWSHAEVCMMALRSGILVSSYQRALAYTQQRWQGGKMIIDHSLIRQMLARLYREHCALYEAWNTLAASIGEQRALNDGQEALALASCERLPWLSSEGIQLLGGIGYMEEFAQERCFRDAKQCESLLGQIQVKRAVLWQQQVAR